MASRHIQDGFECLCYLSIKPCLGWHLGTYQSFYAPTAPLGLLDPQNNCFNCFMIEVRG